jgi:hypothetical protein
LALGIASKEPAPNSVIDVPVAAVEENNDTQPALNFDIESTRNSIETKEEKLVTPPPKPAPTPAARPVSNCHPSYSGCLKMNAGDYDCAGGYGN